MTAFNSPVASRPLAVLLALALMTAFWVPTLSTPSQGAAVAAPQGLAVAEGSVAPVIM